MLETIKSVFAPQDNQKVLDPLKQLGNREIEILKSKGYDLDFLKQVMPQGGLNFDEEYVTYGNGYSRCVTVYHYTKNPTLFWLANLMNNPHTVATLDVSTDEKQKVIDQINRALDELNDRSDNERKATDRNKSAEEYLELAEYARKLTSNGEISKQVKVRVHVYGNTIQEVDERAQELIENLKGMDYRAVTYLHKTKRDWQSMFTMFDEQAEWFGNIKGQSLPSLNIGGGFPFHHQTLKDPGGTQYGETMTGGPFVWNATYKNSVRLSTNTLLLGMMGAGKSTVLKMIAEAHLAAGVMTAAAFEQLSPLQQAIYEQVLKTTVAMFAEKYTYEETTILTQVQQLQLKAIGKVPVDLGWKKLFGKESDGKEKEEEPLLPKVTKGEMVTVDLQVLEKETKPPQPYTEGTLITAMKTAGKTVDSEEAQSILKEVEGIGTEATRANIIEILKQKEYIKVEKNKLVVTNKGILLCQAVEKEPLLTSAEMTAKWESYLLKIGERKGTQTTFLANIQKFVSHLLEVVPGQIQSTDFGSTLQEVKAASEKQEAARHLGICPKCQEQEVILYQKVAACTSEVCDFKLWTTIAKKKLTATQLKEIIQNSRTSQPVKGLKGQKGSFEATIVLKEDFTTGFEFSEKKKTNFKKRTRRTTK